MIRTAKTKMRREVDEQNFRLYKCFSSNSTFQNDLVNFSVLTSITIQYV
jgi:hypothetical protein